jgi:hypothetical protein
VALCEAARVYERHDDGDFPMPLACFRMPRGIEYRPI